ncbi:MAG TPA: LysR family transcriptional regulator [Noviherbaspirillum sp.]|uniref:LysR substrate-binding domain-containing protein n=1 Tax=Noviherbaspirillum sp. TaxID=1926288 RepID=UPI002D44B9C2|nr:LysR family transcriptional regulator [Noviherbaspirillum sp.]HYD93972.1 LysR family transcriptional regulator [Noviherbaspirillum sp.]
MDKLQAMEVFVQVVDAGSFTRAADNMQLPKATVSTLIRNLEQELRAKLLNRTTRQISVTPDGAAYYERCMAILADVRDAEEALSQSKASPRGRLRVEAPAGLARTLLIPALPSFFERYPDIELEMGCTDRTVDLIEEGVDCAVRGGELADSTLVARRVGSIALATCATPSYLALHGTPTHPNDLLQHRCINYFSARTGKIHEWVFMRGDERLQLRVPGRMAINDSNGYLSAGLAGLGIGQMAAYTVKPFIQSGLLEPLLTDWCSSAVPMHVVYPQNRHLSAKVRAFVEWVSELLSDEEKMRTGLHDCPRRREPVSETAQARPATA